MEAYKFLGAAYEKEDSRLTGSTLRMIGHEDESGIFSVSLGFEPIEKEGLCEKIKKDDFLNWIKQHSVIEISDINDIGILCNKLAIVVGRNTRRGVGNRILAGKNIIKKIEEYQYKHIIFDKRYTIEESDKLDDNEIIVGYKGKAPCWPDEVDVGFLFKENEDDLELFFHNTNLANVTNYFAYVNLGENNEH